MSFTAEWTTTTGFDTTGYTVKFGKQLNQCTIDEIVAHPMCGSNHPIANCAYIAKDANLGYSSVAMHLANAQFKEPIPNAQSNTWVCSPAPTGDNALVYRRTIFVGIPTSLTTPQYCLTDQCDNRILIIEDIKNPNKLVYNYGNITWNVGAVANYKTMANQVKHTCNRGQSAWSSAPSTVTYIDTSDPDNPQTTIYKICMYHVYTIGTDCFIIGWDYIGQFGGRFQNASNEYNCLSGGSNYNSFVSANGNDLFIGLNINHTGAETNLQGIMGDDIYPNPVPDPATFAGTHIDYAPQNIVLHNVKLRFTMSNSTIGNNMRSCFLNFSLYDTEEIRKQQFARSGVYFVVNGELFKPIISGGIVIGYGTPEQESEIDTYTDLNHPVPSGGGGGGGGGDDDDIDDHTMGAGTGISGICNLWLLTAGQLADLHSAINDDAPPGFDPLNSFISVMGLGVAPIYLTSDIETQATIKIKQSDGTAWDTGVSGHIVASQVSAFQFTGITVNRKYNNFLDYSPYATHEIFIPMCGWLTLPDIAVDRTMTVTYLPDIESLKCRAVVSVVDDSGDRCVIGEKDGIMGAEVPFTNVGHSLFVGDAIVNGASIAGEVITGAIGAGFTKINAQGGTYRPYEGFTVGMAGTLPGALANAFVSGNVNRTHYTTGNGTRVGFSDGSRIQIKSIYHRIDKPDNYDHTVGKVCNKTGELSTFSGFTVCENPHINFSALESEKEEIKRLLEQGVIL